MTPNAPRNGDAPNAAAAAPVTSAPESPAIPPLVITGLVVTKADLLAALRLYVPQITDIVLLEEDRFVLGLRLAEQV